MGSWSETILQIGTGSEVICKVDPEANVNVLIVTSQQNSPAGTSYAVSASCVVYVNTDKATIYFSLYNESGVMQAYGNSSVTRIG